MGHGNSSVGFMVSLSNLVLKLKLGFGHSKIQRRVQKTWSKAEGSAAALDQA